MSGRVRVLHVITDAGPHPYFEMFGAHTDRDRFDVRLASVGPAGELQNDAARMGLSSFALGARRRGAYPRAALELARRLRRDRIDVVQAHLLDGCAVGLLAARLARAPAAVMTGHHSHEIPMHRRRGLTAVDRMCAGPLCDAVVAPSRQMRDTFVRVHRVRPGKVALIHHGFELNRLDPARVDGSRVRAELDLDGRLVLGSVGRLFWVKNQEALVRALARLVTDFPEAVLVVVGDGDPAPLRELGSSLAVADHLRLLPPRRDIPELLASLDVFVHPALAESFGMVIVEAMAMARPVVSTPVGIAPEVVDNGRTGVLAAGGSVDHLERALRAIIALRDHWPEIGEAGRRRALAFPADRMVAEHERLYLELLRADERAKERKLAAR